MIWFLNENIIVVCEKYISFWYSGSLVGYEFDCYVIKFFDYVLMKFIF